jgi:FkbM family methyltransferase
MIPQSDALVSVIVPSWNSERTLRETLLSVANQTYRNIEILVIDDGSTDSTAAVAEEFCKSEPRARLVRKENGGLSSARNRGIAESRGDWLAPIDADDLWHPTKIEKQMAVALSAIEPIGFVYCWYRIVDEEGHVIESGPRPTLRGSIFDQLAYVNVVENGSALLLWREALLKIGCYDENLSACEDVMLQLRIARSYPVEVVPEYLVAWRRHSSNMSSDVDLIADSARRVYAELIAEGDARLRRIGRWVAAQNEFFTGEQRAVCGQPVSALVHLSKSLLLDPVRSGLVLTYRSLRTTRRRLLNGSTAKPLRRFSNIDTQAEVGGDPHALKGFKRLLERLDARRLERLKAADPSRSSPAAVRRAVSDRGIVPRILDRLGSEADELRLLGGSLFKQRLWSVLGRKECRVRLAGLGSVTVRPRGTDIASFRRVFAAGDYRIPPAAEDAVKKQYEAIRGAGRTPVIVDAGAYVGAASLWFSNYFPDAHVVALEPDPESFRLLRQNLADAGRATAMQSAVAAAPGNVRLVRQAEAWATQVCRSDDGISSITMSEAFGTVPNGDPFIAKINIEGFESDVFSGGLDWLDRIALLFIEPHDWLLPGKHPSRSFQRALGDRDFDLFIVGPHLCYARI